jgi:hypothetical protein
VNIPRLSVAVLALVTGCGGAEKSSTAGSSTSEAGTGPTTSTSSESSESTDTGVDPAEPVIIATNQGSPTGIAVNDTQVFWANRDPGTIVECAITGCDGAEPTVVVAEAGTPLGVSIDATSVYWINAAEDDGGTQVGRAYKCPLSGCVAEPELLMQVNIGNQTKDLQVDGSLFYYAAWPLLGSCDLDGCLGNGPTAFAGGPYVGVDADETHLYLARYGWSEIGRCEKNDCDGTQELLASGLQPLAVAVDAGELYVVDYDYLAEGAAAEATILRCPADDCSADTLAEVASGDISPYAIALSPERLFYTNIEHGTVISEAR